MFREIRRSDRQGDNELVERLLNEGEYGVLSINTEDGYAYGVPVNFTYTDKKIYFHCAKVGQKLDLIKNNNKVSFCIVGSTKVLASSFSTAYESVIAFGKATIVEDSAESISALRMLIEKYSPDYLKEGNEYIEKSGKHTLVVRIDIEHAAAKKRTD